MASMNDKDYYAILGVSKDASTEEIRKAFQAKARKLHPDVNKAPDAEERFKEVSEAYAVLSDEDKRRRYDAMRSGSPFGGGYGAPPNPQGGYADPFGGSPFGWGPFGAGFGGASRRRSRAYNPQVGADVVYELTVNADAAAKGTRRGVTYQRYAPCDVCHGSGSVVSEHAETCPTCGGRGHITVDTGIFGVVAMTCPECEGTGKVVADPCRACGGSGRTLTASEVVVEVPAGSHDGDVVRVAGMGNAGTNGSKPGDFVCRVCVPEERLTRGQVTGFNCIGFAAPFLVLGLITQTLASLALLVAVPVVVGVYLVARDGLRRSARWWRNAGVAAANGASNGLMIAVLFVLLFSCTTGLGMRGYMGYRYY
ncbi:DnaJ domain-containing protein [Olsenella profusa]|uniref:Chaperone protein DnaJ n=1 Tax=Olsenella profusa TaxID=138595 RepID=A0ABS2F2P2_9ACTN|nr:DnaJ domain-containing protein [Olsenella profusa]MBM6775256.1 DnaJ domain-containing protein [Olsenella profusa]